MSERPKWWYIINAVLKYVLYRTAAARPLSAVRSSISSAFMPASLHQMLGCLDVIDYTVWTCMSPWIRCVRNRLVFNPVLYVTNYCRSRNCNQRTSETNTKIQIRMILFIFLFIFQNGGYWGRCCFERWIKRTAEYRCWRNESVALSLATVSIWSVSEMTLMNRSFQRALYNGIWIHLPVLVVVFSENGSFLNCLVPNIRIVFLSTNKRIRRTSYCEMRNFMEGHVHQKRTGVLRGVAVIRKTVDMVNKRSRRLRG